MQTLGVHLDSSSFRTALLSKGRKGIEIQSLSENVKPLYISKLKVVSGLSAKDFLIRSMELATKAKHHLEEALRFQAEAQTFFDPKEVLTLPLIVQRTHEKVEANLLTVSREAMGKHLQDLKAIAMDPDYVSTIPSALCRFARWKFSSLQEAVMIHLGATETHIALMEQGRLKKAHALSLGIDSLLAALFEDRKKILLRKEIEGAAKQIDLLLLKPNLNPYLSSALTELRLEIAKAVQSFCRHAPKEIIIAGRLDAFIHFREFLIEAKELTLTPEEEKFAVAIGLGLEPFSPDPLQLRREEFFPVKNWRKLGKIAITLAASSLFLSGTLGILGFTLSSLRKQEMLTSLQVANEEEMDRWITAVETHNKEYPYICQAPRVAETLLWLSSHPLLLSCKEEGDPMQIQQVHYQLVSYPHVDAMKEPYSAKMEIDFQFKQAVNARKFHEALRLGDEFVNPNMEIGWEVLSDGYRTTFYLKNRKSHVL